MKTKCNKQPEGALCGLGNLSITPMLEVLMITLKMFAIAVDG